MYCSLPDVCPKVACPSGVDIGEANSQHRKIDGTSKQGLGENCEESRLNGEGKKKKIERKVRCVIKEQKTTVNDRFLFFFRVSAKLDPSSDDL